MDISIRSQQNYTLHFSGAETLAELKARVAAAETSEDVLLYVAGKPLDIEADATVAALENFSIDVTVPLFGGKVIKQLNLLLMFLYYTVTKNSKMT